VRRSRPRSARPCARSSTPCSRGRDSAQACGGHSANGYVPVPATAPHDGTVNGARG
jgi:hypothetical protein